MALALFTLDQQRDGNREREVYVLTDGQALPWQGFRTADDAPADAAVILTAGHDQPFLLVRPIGRGSVFQFAVSADRDWSTLPLTAFFVPIIHHVLRHGAGTTQHPPFAPLHTELRAIDFITGFSADDRILAPSGHEAAVRDSGNLTYVIDPLTEPGLYTRVRSNSGEPEPVLVAHTDRTESRLDTVTADELAAWTGFKTFRAVRSPEELLAAADDLHNGRTLVEPLLWLILALRLVFLGVLFWVMLLPGRKLASVEKIRPRFFILLDTSASMTQNHDPQSSSHRQDAPSPSFFRAK